MPHKSAMKYLCLSQAFCVFQIPDDDTFKVCGLSERSVPAAQPADGSDYTDSESKTGLDWRRQVCFFNHHALWRCSTTKIQMYLLVSSLQSAHTVDELYFLPWCRHNCGMHCLKKRTPFWTEWTRCTSTTPEGLCSSSEMSNRFTAPSWRNATSFSYRTSPGWT